MTPDDVAVRLVDLLGGDLKSEIAYGTATVDVPAARWVEAVQAAVADDQLSRALEAINALICARFGEE